MIVTPKDAQLTVEFFTMGTLGFVLGYLGGANKVLSAAILAIATLANHILFEMVNYFDLVNRWLPECKISQQAIYTGTNLVVSTLTILAARHFELISRRTTAIMLFVSAAVLAARLKILASN